MTREEAAAMRTPELVREFATLKVWFAVHEVSRLTPAGNMKHQRLAVVVTELRHRGVLD